MKCTQRQCRLGIAKDLEAMGCQLNVGEGFSPGKRIKIGLYCVRYHFKSVELPSDRLDPLGGHAQFFENCLRRRMQRRHRN